MTTIRRSSAAIAAAIALGLLATAGACGSTYEGPGPSSTATPSGPAASESASPTPTATTDPVASVIDCDTIIPASRREFFATSGLTLFPPADFFAKVRSEGHPSPYTLFQDNGGVVCPWSTGQEVVWAYGYSSLAADQAATAESLILGADPYTTSSYAGGTLYTSEFEGNAFELFLVVDGAWYVATTTEILDELLATTSSL